MIFLHIKDSGRFLDLKQINNDSSNTLSQLSSIVSFPVGDSRFRAAKS